MKKNTWHKHHKWFGLLIAFFIILFCLSGLILNHPTLFANLHLRRSLLPSEYRYQNWNRGLLRASLPWKQKVLLYGNAGIWITDSLATTIEDFNRGFPTGIELRNIRRIIQTNTGQLFAAAQYGLYRYTDSNGWQEIYLPKEFQERITDLEYHNDSLLLLGRSHLYIAAHPYTEFQEITLPAPDNYDGKVSLFRTIWLLHSGELFGLWGRILVDIIALVLLILTVTGILYWCVPRGRKKVKKFLARLYLWHNSLGKWTLLCTLFLCITGWFLRPPALIAIASGRIPPIPFSTMASHNPWHDKLRTLRYDVKYHDWLLYTSEGFYTLNALTEVPRAIKVPIPPVSVMGINVQTQLPEGEWLIGSFSGLFIWERSHGNSYDYFTHQLAKPARGIPISDHSIAGYSTDFIDRTVVVDYNRGTERLRQPEEMDTLPISLRNVALEVHTGRIFTFLGKGSLLYIFVVGIAIAWTIWTGWKCRK